TKCHYRMVIGPHKTVFKIDPVKDEENCRNSPWQRPSYTRVNDPDREKRSQYSLIKNVPSPGGERHGFIVTGRQLQGAVYVIEKAGKRMVVQKECQRKRANGR